MRPLKTKVRKSPPKMTLGQDCHIWSEIWDAYKMGDLENLDQVIICQQIESLIQYGEAGMCFIKNEALMTLLRCSHRRLLRNLRYLKSKGIVKVRYKRVGCIIVKRYLSTKWSGKIASRIMAGI